MVSLSSAGLRIDAAARVLSARGQPIAGLFAAATVVSRRDVFTGFQSGMSTMRGMTQGYLAGGSVAQASQPTRGEVA